MNFILCVVFQNTSPNYVIITIIGAIQNSNNINLNIILKEKIH